MDAEERAAEQPHHMVERAGVLIQHRRSIEELLIPRAASVEIRDRHCNVGNSWEVGHRHTSVVDLSARQPSTASGNVCHVQKLTKRSAFSMRRATSGGLTHCPPMAAKSSSVAPRATAQAFQT